MAQYGFRDIKFKAGVLDPEIEMESVQQLRTAFGPTVCPYGWIQNCAWSVDTSVCVGQTLVEELSQGGYLEDPTCKAWTVWPRSVADYSPQVISTPLASNVAVTIVR